MQLKDEENYKAKNGSWKSAIVQKIDIILKTGELQDLSRDQESVAVENLTKIAGIGPAAASKIFKEENITTIDELIEVFSINKDILNEKTSYRFISPSRFTKTNT